MTVVITSIHSCFFTTCRVSLLMRTKYKALLYILDYHEINIKINIVFCTYVQYICKKFIEVSS